MVDAALKWTNGFADLALTEGVEEPGSELETNILVSLFTDARSTKDVADKRGYWGSPIGSRLWEMFRENATNENLQRVISYCKLAWQWMIDEGIMSDIIVNGSFLNRNGFYIEAMFLRGDNKKYNYLFDNLTKRDYKFDQSTIILDYKL